MSFAAIPIAVLLLGYLPGYATVRWYRARTGVSLGPPGSSPFAEILLSLCLSSWVGILLAECGVFSLARVLLVDLLLSVALMSGSWTSRSSPRTALDGSALAPGKPRGRGSSRSTTLIAGIAIAVLTGAFYLPPFETIIMASDASFYFNTGVHLARQGSIGVPDPLLAELGPEQRALLFPKNVTGGYARVPGGLLLPSLDADIVRPTFTHVLPVWIALFYELGGLDACGLVAIVFAALGLWSIFLFAAETRGNWAAVVIVALVGTSFGQFWFGRFLMPEVLVQFFLWASLLSFVLWWRHGSIPAAGLSALSFGIAGLTRIEYLFFVPLALSLAFALAPERRRGSRLFAVIYTALLAHGLAHLILVPTHYRDVIRSQVLLLAGTLPSLGPFQMVAGGLVLAALLFVIARLLAGGLSLGVRRVATALAASVYAATFAYVSEFKAPTSLAWLASTVPWPLLAAAGIGLFRWIRESAREDGSLALPLVLFLVAGAPFLYDPHVTPIQLWAVRRFVPILIPFAYMFAVTALAWAHGRFVPRRALVLSVLIVAALLALNARAVTRIYRLGFFPDQKPAVRGLAELMSPGDLVFFPPAYTDVLVQLPLWLVYDRESFLLPHGAAAKKAMRAAVRALSARHAVFFVGRGYGAHPSLEGLEFRLRGETEFRSLIPELDPIRAPRSGNRMHISLRLYEVVEVRPEP